MEQPLGTGPNALELYAKEQFHKFLSTYTEGNAEGDDSQAEPFYRTQVQAMRQDDSSTLFVDWSHFVDYNNQIAEIVGSNFYRLEPSLRKALQNFVREVLPEWMQVRLCRPCFGS